MKKAIVGLVDSQAQAELTISALNASGFPPHEVSVVLPDHQVSRDLEDHPQQAKLPEGAIAGAAGGLLGATLGLLMGMGALAMPGLGAFIAAGLMLSAVSGMAAGAAVGGLTGALTSARPQPKSSQRKLANSHILIAVHANNTEEQERAELIFRSSGAKEVATG